MTSPVLHSFAAVAVLAHVLAAGALAQTSDERGGITVREVSLSTGYASVRLPPVTLGGQLPDDILEDDVITSGTAAIQWRHVAARTRYTLDLLGAYTARTRFPELNAPGADVVFGVSHAAGQRWRLGAGIAGTYVSSDVLGFQPSQARRIVDGAASFEDLAGTVALARSPSPDLTQAMLFVPIRQSLDESDLYGNRMVASNLRLAAAYAHSARLVTHLRGSYTTVRRVSSSREVGEVLPFPDSTAEGAGVGITYDRSERTQLLAALDWSRTSGVSADNVVAATGGYGWTGRKWFVAATLGVALRPFEIENAAPLSTDRSRTPAITYSGAIGYKFRTQTLLAQYSRAPHDEFGHGGRNPVTGFTGDVQAIDGSWAWSAARGQWTARSDFSWIRRPGNFSNIHTWLATVSVGRQLGSTVWLMGELLFDRHGSRLFEGFHLTREGARLTLVWTPARRPVVSGDSDR